MLVEFVCGGCVMMLKFGVWLKVKELLYARGFMLMDLVIVHLSVSL